jgi:hypothetical protein
VVVQLSRQEASSGEKAPKEGLYRLKAMFPGAGDDVLTTVRVRLAKGAIFSPVGVNFLMRPGR